MRHSFRVLVIATAISLAACTGDSGPDIPEPTLAFEVVSKDITLQPGGEETFCYYFSTPNDTTLHISKWVSEMTPGSHHMIYFTNLGTQPADGTIDDCNFDSLPLPVYGAQTPLNEVAFPTDDGKGFPLAQNIDPKTPGFFQMHYLNGTDAPLTAHVTLRAYALPDTIVPPHATNHVERATCDVVDGKFWSMTSHSHKQSVATAVKDGASMVFQSVDWEHPGSERWEAPTFHQFSSGQVTWECTYNNNGTNANRTITSGQSARTDEMCMATGYYFPGRGTKGCVFNNGQCQCLL
jgi:hypothetical protein